MEKRIIALGLAGGLAAGLATFVYARLQMAPLIDAAIDFEGERAHVEESLTGGHSHEHEVFSRAVQENVGAAVGTVAFGVIVGALFAVALTMTFAALTRHGVRADLRGAAVATAAAAFVTVALMPSLAYPANPPGVGDPDTAGERTFLYLTVMVVSIAVAALALAAALRLAPRIGGARAAVTAFAGYLVSMTAVIVVMPPVREVPEPLSGPDGSAIFSGFPAELLADFRLSSVISHAVMWTVLGATFAVALPRVVAPAPMAAVAHAGR